ncbi:MAG: helix-turn-helix transcriptional regulator [Bacteroidota bacterium]|nr:helix-turn-helix transcriptional regulator [Bacteroidota bacterium]
MAKFPDQKKKVDCVTKMMAVSDALDVINGKWKLMIIISIKDGNSRFREIERSIPKINSKVLAKELKDLEEHQLIKRTVYDDYPVVIEYTATDYVKSLSKVLDALSDWGINHRKKILTK